MSNYSINKNIKTCRNNCIFCFINQLPKNLRPTLYVKDDDFLLSYTYGNFVTLTNIGKKELDKIVKYRLEPLFISVHSLDKSKREIIFGTKKSMDGVDNLKFLDENGIKTNIQIVLCPGINDGKDLYKTLLNLVSDYNNIISIGMVPVGITKYNDNKILKSYNKDSAGKVISDIKKFRNNHRSLKGVDDIYLSDEFYVMGEVPFPSYKQYKNFNQIENGIGKSVNFLRQVSDFVRKNHDLYCSMAERNKNNKKNHILLVSSEYGKVIIEFAIKIIYKELGGCLERSGPDIDIIEVKNNFFGGNIKITGILSGRDIESSLKNADTGKYCRVLIPESIFNEDNLSIDNYGKDDFKNMGKNVKIIPEDGFSFIKEIFSAL